jgi:hypothetical protein
VSARGLIDLGAVLDRAGATVTFDARRYARAAKPWPDHLPPMFGPENAAVERWGRTAWGGQWVARRPEDWPAPTVAIGERWEQKSALFPTWEEAAHATGYLRSVERVVVQISGEEFQDQCGAWLPWSMINPDHWRRVAPGPRA